MTPKSTVVSNDKLYFINLLYIILGLFIKYNNVMEEKMNKYNEIRWERLIEVGLDIGYLKKKVKEIYNYEIRENSVDLFIENISKYKEIKQIELLNQLEEETYKKAHVFNIKKSEKNKDNPIIDELTTMLNILFKEKNEITFNDGEYFYGELTSAYKVTFYKCNNKFAIIKLARKFSFIEQTVNEDSTIDEDQKNIYDCCKFYIDLEEGLIIMFFNDIKEGNLSPSKEITLKKSSFRQLFSNVNSQNMVKHHLNLYLENYFRDYMKEKRDENEKKLLSIIEATSLNIGAEEERSLIRSVNREYKHSIKRLEAIEDDINNEGLTISEIESCINGNSINVKKGGEMFCTNTFFYKEVIDDVCKELFGEYKLLQ